MKKVWIAMLAPMLLLTACQAPDTDNLALKPAESFEEAHMSFTANLLQEAQSQHEKENICISSYSVAQALGMVANGANGNTLVEIEQTLGGLELDAINGGLRYWRENQLDSKECFVKTANAVFVNTDALPFIRPKDSYVSTVRDIYDGEFEAYSFEEEGPAPINDFVSKQTDGMISKIVEKMSEEGGLFIVNTACFEAVWQSDWQNREETFTDANGQKSTFDFMYDDTLDGYYSYHGNEAFVKPYADKQYVFIGILPKKSAEAFVSDMKADTIETLLSEKHYKKCRTYVYMPSFTYDTDINLKPVLQDMGMKLAWEKGDADFMNMAEPAGADDILLWVESGVHKTHIEVNEEGTKAAAVTGFGVDCGPTSVGKPPKTHTILMNRPFVYMIYDTNENLPLFIGTVNTVN